MLTKTTLTGIKALIFLGLRGRDAPVAPREIANHLGTSPTYLSKITSILVKADILSSHRGPYGGVTISRPTSSITLLEIIESCQGRVTGDYCQGVEDLQSVCAFHQAMQEAHQAIIQVFSRWSLADLIERLSPGKNLGDGVSCLMAGIGAPVRERYGKTDRV